MTTNKPFVFGGISVNSEPTGKLPRQKKQKKEKIIVIEKQIDSLREGYECKEREEGDRILCYNETCKCQYKEFLLEDVKLELDKSTIQNYFTEHKIKNKYTDNILKSEWESDRLKGRWGGIVYNFIYQCKFVYDLKLLINEIPKDKTATETYNCKDRVPDIKYCCNGGKLIKNDTDNKCHCYYSIFTQDQLNNEVMKEWIVRNKDKIKLSTWDKISLTFNWNELSDKQIKPYNRLLIKCMKYFPKPNTTP